MQRSDYTAANRRAWNETAPIHAEQNFAQLLENFQKPGYSRLDAIETAILNQINVAGKQVAQLCCNNGRELLSIKNIGAGRCVGFDISDAFIEQGRQLAAVGKIECTLVATDVYAISSAYDDTFDLVYVTIGAMGWLPDLPGFFQLIARLLKPSGQLFIYEMHPMLNMFEGTDQADPPPLHHSYFRTEPLVDNEGLDYYGFTTYASAPMYWFPHKMADVISLCLQNGLNLVSFQEYDHDISNVFAHFEHFQIKPPLCYTLVAQKHHAV